MDGAGRWIHVGDPHHDNNGGFTRSYSRTNSVPTTSFTARPTSGPLAANSFHGDGIQGNTQITEYFSSTQSTQLLYVHRWDGTNLVYRGEVGVTRGFAATKQMTVYCVMAFTQSPNVQCRHKTFWDWTPFMSPTSAPSFRGFDATGLAVADRGLTPGAGSFSRHTATFQIPPDLSIAAIGAPAFNFNNGRVNVHRCRSLNPADASNPLANCKSASTFSQFLHTPALFKVLTPPAGVFTSSYGRSLDMTLISPHGILLAVSAPFMEDLGFFSAGGVFLYFLRSENFENDYILITPAFARKRPNAFFGGSLAFSDDGSILVIGSQDMCVSQAVYSGDCYGQGMVAVYNLVTMTFDRYIDPPTPTRVHHFGTSVSTNYDGSIITVGNPLSPTDPNAHSASRVFVFNRLTPWPHAAARRKRFLFMLLNTGALMNFMEARVFSGGVNIALNKPVECSSMFGNDLQYHAMHLTDGNTATQYAAAGGGFNYCSIDLGIVNGTITTMEFVTRPGLESRIDGMSVQLFNHFQEGQTPFYTTTLTGTPAVHTRTVNL